MDPADSIFWYGFGQGIVHFFGNMNTALSAYLSDMFCQAWDFVTGQYELVLHSEGESDVTAEDIGGYSKDDIEAMRTAGLTDEDIAEITGTSQKYDGTQPSESEQPVNEGVVIPNNPDETTRVDYELTYYINDINTENTQVLMEYGKRDELKNVYTYGNERISVEAVAETYNTKTDDYETDYYLYDGRGSVAQVVSSEDIVECYTYDPFGNVTSGEPVFDSYYGYNAEDTNPVTGLQYLRARYYDTESGRFSVADTYLGDVSKPLTLNRYTYTVNNPVMQVDPSGHWPDWLDKAVNWVDDKIVQPAVQVVESAVNWVKDNVIEPIGNFVTNLVNSAETGIEKAAEKIQKGYQNIQKTQEEIDRLQVAYIQQKTAEIKQHVVEFSCGTAEKLKEIEESDVWQYLSSSVERFVFGDYSDEDMTLLSFGGTLLAGFAGVDIPLDIRDLVYDVQHYGEDGISVGRLGIDVVALLPVIGVVKNVKYADEVADAVKGVSDAVDGISDTGKVADDVLETTEDVIKGGSDSNKTFTSGEEWYRYFQDTYGANNVHWAANSFEEFLEHPTSLTGYTADEVAEILGDGWIRDTYGSNGEGWKFIQEAHPENMVFYHNGGGQHGGAYYGVSSGKTGKIKIVDSNTYIPTPDDNAYIIYSEDW